MGISKWISERVGLALLTCALAFNAIVLAPEVRIGRLPPNDGTFHLAAAERLEQSLEQGEPFLDPWVSEWSLGYPLFRCYQPLAHLAAAIVLRLTESFASHAAAFAAFQYVLLVLVPASLYAGARLLGIGPVGAGIASLLIVAPQASEELAPYGIGYAATTWRGAGLFSQLFAFHMLVLALGLVSRAIDSGRGLLLAGILSALTCASHMVFGYVVFASGAALALVGPPGARARRVVRLAEIFFIAGLLFAWFAVPLFLGRHEIVHSRWEGVFKFDSFGARRILGDLVSGRLLDAGRPPVLSVLVGVGALAAVLSLGDALPRRLLVLVGLWLALFFGRATWGYLLYLACIPGTLHVHRLQAAFELTAVLLAGWGLERATRAAAHVNRLLGIGVVAALIIAVLALARDRAAFLAPSAVWGDATFAALAKEQSDLGAALADVRSILAERPGRVSAGLAASWGGQFLIGSLPVFTFLTHEHFDEVTFMYHSLSRTSDIMVLRDENDAAHDAMLGVRAVIMPAATKPAAHLRLRGLHGRFAVYEASSDGYFGLVDIGARYTGPSSTLFEASATWLASGLPRRGVVVALDGEIRGLRGVDRWETFPRAPPFTLRPRGHIVSETKVGEVYRARVAAERSCYVLVKITWYPDLVATVDSKPARLLRVTPGFGAVAVPAGEHDIVVSYQPGVLKPVLLLLGTFAAGLCGIALGRPRAVQVEEAVSHRLAGAAERLATPSILTALALATLVLLALRPLLQGKLVGGEQTAEHPPRVVEMARVLGDGQVPPLWAPDLGGGHGQPLFEFTAPLLYAAAAALGGIGLGLADALQLALALLYLAGAAAIYRIGRRLPAGRRGALAGAVAWVFAPFVTHALYGWAAFPEAAAFALAPIALLGLERVLDRPSTHGVMIAAAALALLPLTDLPTAILLLPALVAVAAARPWSASRGPGIVAGGAAILGGIGLSAFFWLPALWEREYVHAHRLSQTMVGWSDRLVSPFQVGPVHILLGIGGLVLCVRRLSGSRRVEAIVFGAAAGVGAWLATSCSTPLWPVQCLAHPYRALCLPALFLSILAVPAFGRLDRRLSAAALATLVGLGLASGLPERYASFDDEYYAPARIAKNGLRATAQEEWEPAWVEEHPPYAAERLVAREPRTRVAMIESDTNRQAFRVEAVASTGLELSTFYYPGWQVEVDGKPVEVSPVAKRGTMAFVVSGGQHRVVAELRPTRIRRLATGASAVSTAALLVAVAMSRLLYIGRQRQWRFTIPRAAP